MYHLLATQNSRISPTRFPLADVVPRLSEWIYFPLSTLPSAPAPSGLVFLVRQGPTDVLGSAVVRIIGYIYLFASSKCGRHWKTRRSTKKEHICT